MILYLFLLLLTNSGVGLRIVAKNPLAACWPYKWHDNKYEFELRPNYSIPVLRTEFAKLAGQKVDIFAVAEIQPAMVSAIFDAGGLVSSEWAVNHVSHYIYTHQNNWKIDHPSEPDCAPWTTNSSNGVAIFARKSSFSGISFSNYTAFSGNSQAYMTATYKGKKIRFVSTHFDSDSYATTEKEMEFTLSNLPLVDDYIDIIAGDFNVDRDSSRMGKVIRDSGFEFDQIRATVHVISRAKPALLPILPNFAGQRRPGLHAANQGISKAVSSFLGFLNNKPPRPVSEYESMLEDFLLNGPEYFSVLVAYEL